MFNEEIELGNLVETIVHGEVIKSMVWVSRLANQLDDDRSEFYKGASIGMKPELTFEINNFEYANEEYVRFPARTGTTYTIIRAAKRNDMRELICTTFAGGEL